MEQVVTQENATSSLAGGQTQQRRGGHRPDDDGTTARPYSSALGKHPSQTAGGTYVPSPVRRVEIPKPNGGNTDAGHPDGAGSVDTANALAGAATDIRSDLQRAQLRIPTGAGSARRGASSAKRTSKSGKDWVVDMDISKFFDRVNHDILMNRIGQTIRDKRVLRLIGNYLRAGVMIEGVVVASEEGTPQGGPSRRCWPTSIWTRWTRNWNGGDWHSAATPMTATSTWAVNGRRNECWPASRSGSRRTATGSQREQERHGAALGTEVPGVSDQPEREDRSGPAECGAIERQSSGVVAELSESEQRQSCATDWRAYIRGWWAYYGLAEERRNIFGLEGWIRRHIRSCFWQRWHNRRGRLRHLQQLGAKRATATSGPAVKGAWRMARHGHSTQH